MTKKQFNKKFAGKYILQKSIDVLPAGNYLKKWALAGYIDEHTISNYRDIANTINDVIKFIENR